MGKIAACMEPAKEYLTELKEKHRENTEKLFASLAEKSEVDQEANARTNAELKKEREKLAAVKAHRSKYVALRVVLIIACILLGVAAIVCFFVFFKRGNLAFLAFLLPVLLLGGMAGLIVLICRKVNRIIRNADSSMQNIGGRIEEREKEAWGQMLPLNRLFDWSMSEQLVFETCPHIRFDKTFDAAKYRRFFEEEKFRFSLDTYESVTGLKSGVSDGNPFILLRYTGRRMVMKVYTGCRHVSWTERRGKQTVACSQTLYASVTHPAPEYYSDSALFYWNDAAPDLTFSRTPQVHTTDEKKIEKAVAKGEKKLEARGRKAMKEGENFTQMENGEFEVLFAALDRSDEVAFRLMFTPLAQKNLIDLIKGKAGFGDDFRFIKRGRVNLVRSANSAPNFTPNPAFFVGCDFEEVKRRFISFNETYFKQMFFQFAPVFSVPLYLQQLPERDFAEAPCQFELLDWVCEEVASRFPASLLAPQGSSERLILKAHGGENAKSVSITANSFITHARIDYIPVMARNGRIYSVPVPWTEYIPVSRTHQLHIEPRPELSQTEFTDTNQEEKTIFVNGIVAKIV